MDDLINDEVRRFFPGQTDEQIRQFYETAKAAEVTKESIFESDLSHARIIDALGWAAFKEYMRVPTGTDYLEDDDFVALTEAVSFVREIDNLGLYAAIYGAAAEATSKKTVASRKESLNNITATLNKNEIAKGV